MTYQRKCPNWLESFRHWLYPQTEAPLSYIDWTGLFTVSSVLKRKVLVSKKKLGRWQAFPHLYIMFIAPAGKARKTTTVLDGMGLLTAVPTITFAPDSLSPQRLVQRLSEINDCAMTIISGELSDLIGPYGNDMLSPLISMFDGKDKHVYDTILRGVELSEKPCINFFAATTPRYISDEMPVIAKGGGFISRVIPIFEERVRRRQLFYEELDRKVLNRMEQHLKDDLNHLASSIEGEFDFTQEAKEFAEIWYRKNADLAPDEEQLSGYHERKPAYIFKLAMILHLMYSDELVIELRDLVEALKMLEVVELKMPRVFHAVGKNPYTDVMDDIVAFIERKEKVARNVILSKFYHAATPEILVGLLGGLLAMEKLEVSGGDPMEKNVTYQIRKSRQANYDLAKGVSP